MAEIGVMKKLTIGGSTYTIPEYSLPIASASTLGGVKIGTGLSINSITGVLSATGLDFDEADPVFIASPAYGITSSDITNWNSKTSNTGTITKVQTSAGAHTTVNVSSGNVSFSVPTKTSHLINDSGFLTSSDLASVLRYKGTKASVADVINISNPSTGDVWHVTADGSEYAYDGNIWQELGTAVDLSGYATKATTLAGYEISDARIENGTITLGSNSITPLTSFTETDPVFSASAAAGITSTDISNWNAKVSDDKTWGGVSLDKRTVNRNQHYLPSLYATTASKAELCKAVTTPTAQQIAMYDSDAYLKSTTPSANDNSTKVATTEFVKSVIPTVLEPLIGNSSEITTEQVKTALQEGRDICIQTTGNLEGVNLDLRFTSWNSAVDTDYSGKAVNAVVSQTIANYGGVYYLFELVGLIGGSWTLLSTTLAQKSDIPTKTSDLTNDSGYITESDVEDEIFIATYNSTSYSDILSAYNADKAVFCKVGDYFAVLNYYANNTFYFSRTYAGRNIIYILSSSGWSSTYYDFVTTQRTVNNKALSADVELKSDDIIYSENEGFNVTQELKKRMLANSVQQDGKLIGVDFYITNEDLSTEHKFTTIYTRDGVDYLMGLAQTALNNKVDKVTGKDLSTNDYTDTEKNKLDGIREGANVKGSIVAKTSSYPSDAILSLYDAATGEYSDFRVYSTQKMDTMFSGATTILNGKVDKTSIGQANGVAPLDANSKIDSQYLPSYVDDVVEAYARSGQTALSSTWLATGSATGTVITPEAGVIYILMADSGDYTENTQFRWAGTTYVKLNDGGVSAITNAEIDTIVAS